MTTATGVQLVGGAYLSEDDMSLGDVYLVEFEDGSSRSMRRVVQNKRADHVWLEVATGRLVIQAWRVVQGQKGPRPTRFKNPDLSPAFDGAWVAIMHLASESA